MAKHKSKKSGGTGRGQSNRESARGFTNNDEIDTDIDNSNDMDMADESGAGSSASQGRSAVAMGSDSDNQQMDPKILLERFREFIEGHPGRATLLGAALGGLAAGLFSTETGRSLLRASYGYARPMISDFAQKFVSNQSSAAIENTLPQ